MCNAVILNSHMYIGRTNQVNTHRPVVMILDDRSKVQGGEGGSSGSFLFLDQLIVFGLATTCNCVTFVVPLSIFRQP